MAQVSGLFLAAIVLAFAVLFIFPQYKVGDSLTGKIEIIDYDENVESHLKKFKNTLGDDIDAYRGHIYRVLTYTMHFLHDDESYRTTIATSLVYHDIGLWADNKLDYLETSCKRAKKAMKAANFSPSQVNLGQDIIYWHHKLTEYEDGDDKTNRIVNAVRKADWIDASYGYITHGMPKEHIKQVMNEMPTFDFHTILLKFGPKLRGWNIIAIITELGSIFKF